MELNQILDEEKRIHEMIKREYVDSTDDSAPIYDGVVNPAQYISSSPRILWILKEPYDSGDAYKGGDWSLTDDLLNKETDMMSRKRAFQPICYINYGIWTGVHAWDEMPWLRDCEEIRNGLRKIAFINVSKLPALKWSAWGRIVEAYQKHRGVILDQIRIYAPNVVFACDPHANLMLKDFGFSQPQWKWFGSAASIRISSEQRLVWIAHPSQRAVKRATYVNDAVKAATAELVMASARS
jgi:hypothetical protein